MECHQRGSRGEVGASQTKEEPRTFYCFVTPDRADITHDRVHILVKTLMFIVLSFVLAPARSQIISECEQDIGLEISANNLYASCQH